MNSTEKSALRVLGDDATAGKLVGIGLRPVHYRAIRERLPAIGWLEAHSENYFGEGGQPLLYLERFRQHYPLSLHGVGLSIGSADPLSQPHLQRLAQLCVRLQPFAVSEHLCWSSIDGRYANDLLPLPYTEESLVHVSRRVGEVQDALGRQILIENVSSYLEFEHSTIPEWEFLVEVARRAGCRLLLDVNNIYVSACNHGFDATEYLEAIPAELVSEIHLAGFDRYGEMLIDTHATEVAPAVWGLYREALERLGRKPTLIEWDTDIPPLDVLLGQANRAESILQEHCDARLA